MLKRLTPTQKKLAKVQAELEELKRQHAYLKTSVEAARSGFQDAIDRNVDMRIALVDGGIKKNNLLRARETLLRCLEDVDAVLTLHRRDDHA